MKNNLFDNEKIMTIQKEINDDATIIQSMVNDIVKKYTADLDELMAEINDIIICKEDTTDTTLAKYFLELSNAYYFISSKCEVLGLYEDVAKNKAKLAYNNAYTKIQDNLLSDQISIKKGKPTVAELTSAAENATMEETVLSSVYTRSFKVIKIKLDAASTMISTISKIISSHMTEANLNNLAASNLNNGV